MKKLLIAFAFTSIACLAQYETILGSATVGSSRPQLNLKPAIQSGVGAPSGACTSVYDLYLRTSDNTLYGCVGSTWVLVSSGGVGGGIADPGSNGILSRTALNTTVARTITGTANQITVTNGDGVSGAPTLSFPTNMTLPGTTTGTFSGNITGDVTGNVSGTSGSTTGNAATATVLQTARTINGTSFNGSANITITASLPANPTACSAGQYVSDIAADGTLTCAQVAYSQVSGTPSLATIATSGSASDLASGTVPTARLGSGTANSSTFLRGDNTWQVVSSGSSTPPYTATVTAQTTLTVAAATHLQGSTQALLVGCLSGASSPWIGSNCYYTVASDGTVVFTWSPAFTGGIIIGGSGTGPAGATGATGATGPAGPSTVSDAVFTLQDNGDATKQLLFQLSGITTATTRTITVPDASGTLALTSSNVATATALATPRAIYGNNFDGTAALTQIIASGFGGTGNGFTKFSGATTSEKTYTLPNSSTTIVTIADTGSVTNTMLAGSIDLTAKVSGILPGANGGSGNGFFAVSGPTTSLKTFTFPNASATVLTSNAVVTVAQGGIGVATLTGIAKGNGTSAFTAAVAADIYGLWSGTCSSSTFLRGDGSCQTPSGSGTINSGVTNVIPKYTASTTLDDSLLSDDGTTLAYTGTGGVSATAFTITGTMGGQSSWQAGTGNQNALPSNSAGFVAPTTGGTSYLIRFPATITAGIPLFGTPGTVDNVNQSAMTVLSTTGSGDVVRATSATLFTPALGTPSALVCTNCSGTAASLTAGAATVLATGRTIGNVSFNGSANIVPETMAVIDSTDSTSSIAMFDSATGNLQAKTDAGLTYNATTGVVTATGFAGPLTGAVTGNASTSTALAADPTDCSSNQPAIGIVAAGTATCMTLTATIVKSTSGVLSAATAGTDYVAPGGALGTPSSGDGTNLTGVTHTIASGTKALDTDAILTTACDTLATTTATGAASTDTLVITPNADISGVTGYTAATTGGLTIYYWLTTNTINWKVCNPTSSTITPGAVTLNYRIVR